MEDEGTLREAIENYKDQISKVNKCIQEAAPGAEYEELLSLKENLEELLKLTNESLNSLEQKQNDVVNTAEEEEDPFEKEYALFKAQLEAEGEERNSENQKSIENDSKFDNDSSPQADEDCGIQNELDSLIGKKCRAPYSNKYNAVEYHNALIVGIEIPEAISDLNHIKVRVLFTNPTERDMVPCPYFLDDKCNFGEDRCNFSHGYLASFGDLQEYQEPDFSNLKVGSRVLAKIGNAKVWKSTAIEDIVSDEQVLVKHEGNFASVPIHDILPLTVEDDDSDLSSDDENDMAALRSHQESMVELSLSREPQSQKIGDWEKFTKGIGSRLMAKMGYVVGTGLGKNGEGRLDPVEAVVLPAGKSLDHCMNLKEAAGGSNDLFSAEKLQKKLALREIRRSERAYRREKHKEKHDVFNFINTKLTNEVTPSSSAKLRANEALRNKLAKTSGRELNIERMKIAEDIKDAERRIYVLNESLTRQKSGTLNYKNMLARLESERGKLSSLKNIDQKVEREQTLRETKRKMTIF